MGSTWTIHTPIMNDALQHWNQKAWALLEQLPGGFAAALRTQWDEFAKQNRVVVTLFGPYDTGKSSLLKRLLVDDGRSVPEWLTISARRETFEQNEVEVCGVLVRDTPGVSGGNDVHEASAEAALLRSDVVVVMLPPQLITGDHKSSATILSVLDGSRFHCGPSQAFALGGLFIVIARMDGGGAEPDEYLAGYEALVEVKRKELRKLLATARVDDARISIHVLAADRSGMVGNAPDATPATYDASRAWDGVADFATSLHALANRHDELRLWSERRFLRTHFGSVYQSLKLTVEEARLACAASANEVEAITLQAQRLKALIDGARASLDHRIAEEVQSACQRGDTTPEAVKAVLRERVGGSLERWCTAQDADMTRLAEEFDAEVEQRHSRPDWQAMVDALDDEVFTRRYESQDRGESEVKHSDIQRISQKLRTAFREVTPAALNMPMKKAKEELGKLRKAGSFQQYAKEAARRTGSFRDSAHADWAKKAVQVEWVFDAAVPAVIEIAGLVSEIRGDVKAAEARITKRAKLQKTVDMTAAALAGNVWREWHDEGLPAALAAALHDARASAEARSEALQHHRQSAEQTLATVQALMNEARSAH
jgi:hypothetical protein